MNRPRRPLRWRGMDDDALAQLYREHAKRLLAFFARRTFDAEAALELMAETFAQAVLKRRSFRGGDAHAAQAWLFGIARNQLALYFRRGGIHRRALERLKIEAPSLPDAELARIEELAQLEDLRAVLRDELARLGDEQRAAIALRVVAELPYPEVARRLGVTEDTARARVSRGLRALAEALDESLFEGVEGA